MNICVIGSGYVGLVTGVSLAKLGHKVICVDVVKEKIDAIKRGEPPIFEKGLESALKKVLADGSFSASSDLKEAMKKSDCVFICVGTPSKEDGSIDLKYVFGVAEELGEIVKDIAGWKTIIVKSTVVPGTTGKVKEIVERVSGKKAGKNFGVGMNPEFLKEGDALEDFMNLDRIVLGAEDEKTLEKMREIYAHFKGKTTILETNAKTAEMIKYANNAFLAARVSLINEIGNVCKKLGIDAYKVAEGIGLDNRIGPRFLASGMGFGGSCFSKDVKAIAAKAREVGVESYILNAVLKVNEGQPAKMIEIAKKHGKLKGKRVAILGLAFKPETDDVRESRAVVLVQLLLDEGCIVNVFDPKAMKNAKGILGDKVKYCNSASEALKGAELCFIATEWEEFKKPELYKGIVVIDGRNTVRLSENYEGICW